MTMRSLMAILSGSIVLAATSVPALAQQKPDDVIKFRKGIYQVINWHIRPLAVMVKGGQPYNPELFTKNAAMLDQMARLLPESYVPGSDVGDTRAKPEIWKEPEKFKQAMDRLQAETGKLSEVSKGGNFDVIRTQFGAVTKACSGCHDAFRTK